jgi:hypothetical protein
LSTGVGVRFQHRAHFARFHVVGAIKVPLDRRAHHFRELGHHSVDHAGVEAHPGDFCSRYVFKGDLIRRSVVCRLDPKVERPELRQFAYDPIADAKDHRAELVAAVLTILRAYHVAGYPARPTRLQSFEVWSDTVRGALVWLGAGDPAGTVDRLRKVDPVLASLTAVLLTWRGVFGSELTTVHSPEEMERLADGLSAERAASRWIVSTDPDEHVERIGYYVDLGFDHLVFHAPGPDQERFLRLYAEHVLPRLRRLDGAPDETRKSA